MARQFSWIAPDGATLVLTDKAAGYSVKASGTRGLSAPPYLMTVDRYAGISGTTLQSLNADQREVSLGLQVEGDTVPEFRARWRALVRAMRPMAGDGVLRVADEWGVVRELTCRYAGGLEGDAEAEFPGTLGRAVVKLVAFDPWWYGPAQPIDVGLGVGPNFFPFFPLVLAPSSVQGQFTVDLSDADAPTYPLWTITGPGSGLVLANQTTGQVITVNTSLSLGQAMVIDTRPGYQSVRRDTGANLMEQVTSDPALWGLIDGVNRVSAQLTGATSASRITATYRSRYAGI